MISLTYATETDRKYWEAKTLEIADYFNVDYST